MENQERAASRILALGYRELLLERDALKSRIEKAMLIADYYDNMGLNYPTGDVVANFRTALEGR